MKLKIIAGIACVLLLAVVAGAQNDPGHDTLYVLKVGDSNVTGSINISNQLTADLIKITSRFFGDFLDIRANGTINTGLTAPAIQAASSDLYLDSTANVYINTNAGTTGIVQIGDSANGILLNVSGNITIANGGTINGSTICTPANGLCSSGISSAGGWTNTSTTVTLSDLTNTVNANTLWINNSGGLVGIGTADPTSTLFIDGAADRLNYRNHNKLRSTMPRKEMRSIPVLERNN